MSYRMDVLNNIVDDIKAKVNYENDYTVEPIHVYNSLKGPSELTQLPSVCVVLINDNLEEEGNQVQLRRFRFLVYGVTKNLEEMFDLSEDMEYFLFNGESTFIYGRGQNASYKVFDVPDSGPNYAYSLGQDIKQFSFDFQFEIVYTLNV